jgi:hypothetical protein
MARYSSFLGYRVEVQYRASDTLLPASGVLVADSGRSIFLEQSCEQRGLHHHFRWEIPYQYLVRIARTDAEESATVPEKGSDKREITPDEEPSSPGGDQESRASGAAAGAGLVDSILPLRNRSHTA